MRGHVGSRSQDVPKTPQDLPSTNNDVFVQCCISNLEPKCVSDPSMCLHFVSFVSSMMMMIMLMMMIMAIKLFPKMTALFHIVACVSSMMMIIMFMMMFRVC